jgi:hypothetical protein
LPTPDTHPRTQREWVAELRRWGLPERPLVGWPAILAYVRQAGIVTREGLSPVKRTVQRWIKTRRFPVSLDGIGLAWSTDALIRAWALAEGRRYAPRDARGRLTRPVNYARRRTVP